MNRHFIPIVFCLVLLISFVKIKKFSAPSSADTKGLSEYIEGFVYSSAWNKSGQLVFLPDNSKNNGLSKMLMQCNDLDEDTLKKLEHGAYLKIKIINNSVKAAQKAVNPGGFDQSEYLAGRNIKYVISPKNINIEITDGAGASLLLKMQAMYYKTFAFIRNSIKSSLNKYLCKKHAAIAMAVITGDTGGISSDEMENFRSAGISHVMAVSGMHVGFISSAAIKILSRRKISYTKRNALQAALLLCFACIADFSPSVTRAFLQSLYVIVARISRRPCSGKYGICLSCTVQLISNPYILFNSGFILSYTAAASVIWIKPALSRKIFFFGKLNNSLGTGLSVNIGMFPMLVNFFNSFSPVGLPASIFAGKLAYWICISGMMVWLADLLSICSFIIKIPAGIMALTLTMLENISNVGSSVPAPFGAFNIPSFDIKFVILYYIIILVFIKQVKYKMLKKYKYIALCAGIAFWGIFKVAYSYTEIIFFDVGQGACAYIETNKICGLIDGGDGKTDVSNLLLKNGVGTLDFIILTHGHADHSGGIYDVLEEHNVRRIFIPDNPYDEGISYIKKKASEKKTEIIYISDIKEYKLKDLNLRICMNAETAISSESSAVNNSSLVAFVRNNNGSVLFTGDIEEETETVFTQKKWITNADILYVAHHGADTSSKYKNISIISPEYAIISAGRNNSYGHPAERVTETLRQIGAEILRNDLNGAIKITMRKGKIRAWRKLAT